MRHQRHSWPSLFLLGMLTFGCTDADADDPLAVSEADALVSHFDGEPTVHVVGQTTRHVLMADMGASPEARIEPRRLSGKSSRDITTPPSPLASLRKSRNMPDIPSFSRLASDEADAVVSSRRFARQPPSDNPSNVPAPGELTCDLVFDSGVEDACAGETAHR